MRFALLCVLLVGCQVKNPHYCPPGQSCVTADALESCSATKPCMSGYCNLTTQICVECLEDAHCTMDPSEPICSANSCGACTKHSDCDSAVCQDDGSCAAKESVLYVRGGSPNTTMCTFEAPCGLVTYALGITPMRSIIKVDGTITETSEVSLANRSVTIYAESTPQAVLTRPSGNEIVRIDGNSAVSIFDLQISNATGNGGHGISILSGSSGAITLKRVKLLLNAALGLSAMGSGMLVMTQSTVYDNTNGGISIAGTHKFDITSNFILYNGDALGGSPSLVGGAQILSNQMGSKLEFNTIAFNQSSGLSNRAGLQCNAPMVAAGGNIVYRNGEPDGVGGIKFDMTTQNNTGAGTCNYGNSLVTFFDADHLGFVSPITTPHNFHLKPTASGLVVNMGGMCSVHDIDNEPRPSGTACELGADELP